MLEFLPGRYCSQLWFLPAPSHKLDVLAALFLDADNWTFIYRFRYDEGSIDVWDGTDSKSWTMMTIAHKLNEGEVLQKLNQLLGAMAQGLEAEVHILPLRSSDTDFIMKQIAQQPWAHVRRMEHNDDKDESLN